CIFIDKSCRNVELFAVESALRPPLQKVHFHFSIIGQIFFRPDQKCMGIAWHASQYQEPHRILLVSYNPKIKRQHDKLRAQQQLEQLQARYVGTGHADTTKFEWSSNIQRDSYASYVGHPPLLSYMAIGMGECREKVRGAMIEKMIQPVGKPPEVQD
ncbi:Uncharacterized protein LSUB1_G005854, partial [Lachnellula subtilissima]